VAVALGGSWHARERENRAFGLAILASIAIHAALLGAFPEWLERKKSSAIPERLTARLVTPEPVAAPPAPVAEETPKPQAPKPEAQPPKPQAETPKPPAAKPARAPKEKPMPAETAAPQRKPVASPPAPAEQPSQAVAGPAPAAPSTAPAPADAAPPPIAPAAPSADDIGTIERFRLEIIAQAKRFKRYPRLAMDNNWEGRTDVRIVFGADGRRVSMTIARSSGHEALDKQALDTLSKAFVPVPAALRGKEFTVVIPVIYSLKDENA
jgi:protein TonB